MLPQRSLIPSFLGESLDSLGEGLLACLMNFVKGKALLIVKQYTSPRAKQLWRVWRSPLAFLHFAGVLNRFRILLGNKDIMEEMVFVFI